MKISNIKKISGRVLSYIVSRESIITLITCVAVSIIIGACMVYSRKDEDKSIKVGIIYVGDASTAYTDNFIEALADIKEEYGDKVEVMHMYNVAEGTEREYLERLVNAGCNLIFSLFNSVIYCVNSVSLHIALIINSRTTYTQA